MSMLITRFNQAFSPKTNKKLAVLVAEHDDLDYAISMLLALGTCDDLLIKRLKKRKLHLKDEIALIPPAEGRVAAC
jgi:hypothetical protein